MVMVYLMTCLVYLITNPAIVFNNHELVHVFVLSRLLASYGDWVILSLFFIIPWHSLNYTAPSLRLFAIIPCFSFLEVWIHYALFLQNFVCHNTPLFRIWRKSSVFTPSVLLTVSYNSHLVECFLNHVHKFFKSTNLLFWAHCVTQH